jgi:hypothetical protein
MKLKSSLRCLVLRDPEYRVGKAEQLPRFDLDQTELSRLLNKREI